MLLLLLLVIWVLPVLVRLALRRLGFDGRVCLDLSPALEGGIACGG